MPLFNATASLPTTPVSAPKLVTVADKPPSYTLLAATTLSSVRALGVTLAVVVVALPV